MPIEFYFDYLSPYAYLAWCHHSALFSEKVEPIPVLLAALLNHHKILGPAEIPAKRPYIFRNSIRLANDYGVALNPPASHPFNPLLALRASSLPMTPEQRRGVVDRIFRATWEHGVDISDQAALRSVLPELDLDQAQAPENKERLKGQTEQAIARGVFGVPTFMVGDELFWGCDSMDHVAQHLRGEDPLSQGVDTAWLRVRPSAVRVPR